MNTRGDEEIARAKTNSFRGLVLQNDIEEREHDGGYRCMHPRAIDPISAPRLTTHRLLCPNQSAVGCEAIRRGSSNQRAVAAPKTKPPMCAKYATPPVCTCATAPAWNSWVRNQKPIRRAAGMNLIRANTNINKTVRIRSRG